MSETTTVSRAKSPNYPNYSLKKALAYAETIFSADRRNPLDRAVTVRHMGYTSLSGAADKAISTMMQYGLLEKVGKGEVRISQVAVDILHPDRESDRKTAIVRAAFSPSLFKTLKDRFPDDRFSDDALRSFLMREGFLERALSPVLSAYTETIAFLQQEKATESGGAPASKDRESPTPNDETTFGGAAVGDLIQWESNGVLKLETPKRVRLVSDDGNWVCVEGSETGISMSEVIVEQKGTGAPPPVFPLTPKVEEVGEAEWMRNKLSLETNVRLLVKGKMGPKEIGKLIKLLEAQRAVLEDEDGE